MALNDTPNYEGVENEMYSLLCKDPFFSGDGLMQRPHVQSLAHLTFFRNVGSSLFATGDQVDEAFNKHAEAIRLLDAIAASLKTSATEIHSSIKAVSKAKEMERKEQEKEEKRQKDAIKRREQAEAKRAEAKKVRDKKAAEAAETEESKKKRRQPARIASELADSDPPVLKEKFPEHELSIYEKVAPGCSLSLTLSSLLV